MDTPNTLVILASNPACALRAGGLGIAERTLRAAARMGLHRAVLLGPAADPLPDGLPLEPARSFEPLCDGALVLVVRGDVVLGGGDLKALAQPLPEGTPARVLSAGGEPVAWALADVEGPAGAAAILAAAGGEGTIQVPACVAAIESARAVVVRDEATRRAAHEALFAALGKPVDGMISRLLNRRISTRVTRLLIDSSVTPNHMTVVAMLIGITGVAITFTGGYWALLLGALLVQTQSVLDGCDGEIARLKYQFSNLGQWLDNVTDDVVNNSFVLAVGVNLWLSTDCVAALIVGAAASFGYTFQNLVIYHFLLTKAHSGDVFLFRWWFEKDVKESAEQYDPASVLTFVRNLGRRDTYLFLYFVLAAAGLPWAILGYAAVISSIAFGMGFYHAILHPLVAGKGRRARA